MPSRDALAVLDVLVRALPTLAERAVTATVTEAEAQARRTSAFHNRTGRLRASLRSGVLTADATHIIGALTAGAEDADPGRGGDWTAPSNEYAPAIELGTSRSTPRAFVWPALVHVANQGTLGEAMQRAWDGWQP